MLQNVYRIEGDITYISLTQGKETVISTSDLERVLQVRWHATPIRRNGDWYARGVPPGAKKAIMLHRYILHASEDDWVDHINFDTLDNRRENLRLVTPSENRLHQRRQIGQSGIENINIVKLRRRTFYRAAVGRHGKEKSKSFPYTEEGLEQALDLVAKWKEDFSYEPPRAIQRRARRANFKTITDADAGPHIDNQGPGKTFVFTENSEVQGDETTAYLPLSRGVYTLIDRTDWEKANHYSWRASPHQMGGYYAISRDEQGKTIYLHRYLLDAPPGMYVDHINHNTLDNRRSNLRLVSNQENNANRNGAYNTSKTGVRGVSVHKCKPSGFMYVFRCHNVTCKKAKYFPFTEEGLKAARAFAEAHYAAMKT